MISWCLGFSLISRAGSLFALRGLGHFRNYQITLNISKLVGKMRPFGTRLLRSQVLQSFVRCSGTYFPVRCASTYRKHLVLSGKPQWAFNIRTYSSTTDGHEVPQEIDSMSINEYHHFADEFMEGLLDQLELLGEEYPQIDVEYSQGVMTLEIEPLGTYVINKQPPNKQIWISSPESGPDRFDKIGGEWVSLRTGENLATLLGREVGETLGEVVQFES